MSFTSTSSGRMISLRIMRRGVLRSGWEVRNIVFPMEFLALDGRRAEEFWLHPKRGEVALGWEVCARVCGGRSRALSTIMSPERQNDYLICGPAGIGYNYLSGFWRREGFLQELGGLNATALKIVGSFNRVVNICQAAP